MSFKTYLKEIRRIYSSDAGTPENSYVPTLVEFLKSVLTEVEIIPWPKGNEEGLPDIGISLSNAFEGYVEAEALSKTLNRNTHGREQAEGYSKEAPTLLTNFYEFQLIDQGGLVREFAFTKDELLKKALDDVVATHETNLLDFLNDWATRQTPINDPEALAERLSEYAKNALARLDKADATSLNPLRKAMEEALGIKIKDKDGEHFFKSGLIQALFYGLFSAWVEAAKLGKAKSFELHEASNYLKVPLVVELFEELTQRRRIKSLDLESPIKWAIDALKRVVPESFLKAFENGEAVQYFYEPFLDKFDKQLRKDLGVWYTPREIVRYQVMKTDQLLKEELGITKGLLDDRVVVLDPATGTGSYLVEIGRYLLEKLAGSPLAGRIVKEAFQKRIFGFELLPAPFVIAHLQLGLLLADANAPLKEGERVGVYLTNSLLGWKEDPKERENPIFPQFAKEKEAADKVKRKEKILVFIGNPPYDRFAGVAEDEQADLIAPYKKCLYESWGVRKQTLNDLYIRFIRLAEHQIAETNLQEGVISLITNRSFLTGLSHPVMREHLVKNFHKILIDDLQGGQRANRVNNGNVFTTETAGGVRVGVCISHYIKKKNTPSTLAQIYYREFSKGSGRTKRKQLAEQSINFEPPFTPTRRNRYVLKPLRGEDQYWLWPNLQSIFPVLFSGVNTNRDEAVITFDADEVRKRMKMYYDPAISNQEVAKHNPVIMKNAARYNPQKNRELLLRTSKYIDEHVIQYHYRPFDKRWLYWEEEGKLLNEKRKEFFEQVFETNVFLVSSQTMRRGYDRHSFSKQLIDLNIFDPNARAFPLKLRYHPIDNGQASLFTTGDGWQYLPNAADFYDDLVQNQLLTLPKKKDGCEPMPKPEPVLSRYGITTKDGNGRPTEDAFKLTESLFYHTLAIMNTPEYREDHAEYLAEDWPRIPLPKSHNLLEEGENLGKQVATLLDPLSDASKLLNVYSNLGKFAGQLDNDLEVGANPNWEKETLHLSKKLRLENVPENVWNYTLGGYPVLNKWLSYPKYTTVAQEW